MAKKYVYGFNEGNEKMREILGGKGANLAAMTKLGLPVPFGFTVSTEVCREYYANNKTLSQEVENQILKLVKKTEKITGKKLGDLKNPLLLSVRSGSRVSMPGMMNTILNLGLNDEVVKVLATSTSNEWFAYDSYRRFIMMYAEIVKGMDRLLFENQITELKQKRNVVQDSDLTVADLKLLVKQYKTAYKQHTKEMFPQDPIEQLMHCVMAVFDSWETPRAKVYRRLNDIPNSWGTAVNVQAMVFGNMGMTSGSGVAFTRNPANGVNELFGEYLMNAQGEDVVAGVRTPQPISKLEQQNPTVYAEFVEILKKLENHYHDMQDIEFTIENGKLFILQTRSGKRTANASLQIAIDMVNEGLISKREALLNINPNILDSLLHPTFEESKLKKLSPLSSGLPASPGAASGIICLSSEKAKKLADGGKQVILVREETNPEDIEGMNSAQGVLTATGGMTSHAAVVARGIGKPCVAGCNQLIVREDVGLIKINGIEFKEGQEISIDGTTGFIYAGLVPTKEVEMTKNFEVVMGWADQLSTIEVRANADNAKDASVALKLGAKGIGLTRTEHMFFEKDRIKLVREMILANNVSERQVALDKLLPIQKSDFVELFKVLNGLPITVRLLDMPLHEFLPKDEKEIESLAKSMKKPVSVVADTVDTLSEFNPMLGFRGCRLSIVMPEITIMQTTAILEGAIDVKKQFNILSNIEIMVPLVGDKSELDYLKKVITNTANQLFKKHGVSVTYSVGSMIEVPRAAILSNEIAQSAEFFSFGTNDLTQMTYAFSRDDSGKFLQPYKEKGIVEFDPFVKVDQKGVGALIEMSVKLGRSVNAKLKCGMCGEHAGEITSIDFAHRAGINYVSCSPYRVPIARLASAHANINNSK